MLSCIQDDFLESGKYISIFSFYCDIERWMDTIKKKVYQSVNFFFLDITIDVIIFFVVFWYSLLHRTKNFHHIFGTTIALISLGLRILSRIHLGESFSVKSEAKILVTKGVYARIRNPIYTFSLLAFTGVLISLGKPRLFMVLLIFVGIEMIRWTSEKKILHETFGEEYKEYRRKTWF